MTNLRHDTASAYMYWARTRSNVRFNLASSGIRNLPLSALQTRLDDLELTGPGDYGYQPLQKLLAARYGVDPGWIVAATGASMANHLAMAAVVEPGDEVLIEQPTYELLLNVAQYLGAKIIRFDRRFDNAFRLEPTEIERAVTRQTRLIVLTNLHNPSGVLIEQSTLREIGEIAHSVGARVLVDEVYLDLAFQRPQRSSIHLGKQFIVTSSLTKAYGLSGLRCGWIFAEPELAQRMWRLNDIFAATPVHLADQLSVVALERLPEIAAQTCRLLEANRALLKQFLDSRSHASHGDLSFIWPAFGTIVFPRLLGGDVDSFCNRLREKYETSVVPGSFFEMPQHFRIGVGGETAMVAEGLKRLSAALDELSS